MRVEGLANLRDLGGLRRTDGSETPYGVFWRSAAPDAVTPRGWRQLRSLGVRTVVDLRQPGERDGGPRPGWLRTAEVDLDGLEDRAFWRDWWGNGLVGTALYYAPHVRAMPYRLASALTAVVSAPPGGVLFHCQGGRDRTGVVALALLRAADVEPEEVVADYLETVRLDHLGNEEAADELCRQHGTTTDGAFRGALDELDLPTLVDLLDLDAGTAAALHTWRGHWAWTVLDRYRHDLSGYPRPVADDAEVLARVLRHGRVVQVPTRRTKRLVVLGHVAQAFLPGLTYPKTEVGRVLLTFHDDHAALRRHLVDDRFLTRDGGVDWRSGSTVDV